MGLPSLESEKPTSFTCARTWDVHKSPQHLLCITRVDAGPLDVCTSSHLLIVWHPASKLTWQSEVGPEFGEPCHLLHRKTRRLFLLGAYRVYSGDLAGLVSRLQELSCSHRSLQRLPVHTKWIKPRALHEHHGKKPKAHCLGTPEKVQDTPLKQERLL